MDIKADTKSLLIATTRFGQVQISASDIISFPEGILGFNELKRFVLLDDPNDEIFAWLQACDDAGVAFPVLEPELFADNLQDAERLNHHFRADPVAGKDCYFELLHLPHCILLFAG